MNKLHTLIIALLFSVPHTVLAVEPVKLTMYKQAGCMCCDKHAELLEEQGFDVDLKTRDNVNFLKAELGIQPEFAGCHTMLVDDYIVEGHVPGNIIKRLLAEKPDIKGIALPGMPKGTPGMPGVRNELLDVYVLEDGQRKVYDRF
ncbi:MAG: DUF411 domain-containing protein [Gammaproteobacteria bacterium]